MASGDTTLTGTLGPERRDGSRPSSVALVIAWSAEEPERAGEVAMFETSTGEWIIGRGEASEGELRASFRRVRPGAPDEAAPIAGGRVSRRQLSVRTRPGALAVERLGRCETRVNGEPIDKAIVVPGDIVTFDRQLVLYAVAWDGKRMAAGTQPTWWGSFGEPDQLGILGEGSLAWSLREQIAFAAAAPGHVLVHGPSGSGKELVARGIHALSTRAAGPFLARNAATFTEGLIDAELFGNVKNYPNPGMVERAGLIGEASGGTLFLDEIGDLPLALQSHLLRVLDGGGEYQRLGEATPRRADLRLVGATHRDPTALRHDLLGRLTLRVDVPPLSERREDIPLLLRHLLRRACAASPGAVSRLERDRTGVPRLSPELIEWLLGQPLPANVRQLDALLWRAIQTSTSSEISLTDGVRALSEAEPPPATSARSGSTIEDQLAADLEPRGARPVPRGDLDAEAVQRAVEAAGGNLAEAARQLGLSRYAFYRLLRKLGLEVDALRR